MGLFKETKDESGFPSPSGLFGGSLRVDLSERILWAKVACVVMIETSTQALGVLFGLFFRKGKVSEESFN